MRRLKLMRVQGHSMQPTLRPGALVVVDQQAYKRRQPNRSDVVVARFGGAAGRACIKRLIGLPHDELVVGDRHWRLQADEYFLVGDAQEESTDSRALGPVTQADMIGRVRYYR